MKSYRGGVRRSNFSFFFPNNRGQIVLVTARSAINQSIPGGQITGRELFAGLACGLNDNFRGKTSFLGDDGAILERLDESTPYKNFLLSVNIVVGDANQDMQRVLSDYFKPNNLFYEPLIFSQRGALTDEDIERLNRNLLREQTTSPFLRPETKANTENITGARNALIQSILGAQQDFIRKTEQRQVEEPVKEDEPGVEGEGDEEGKGGEGIVVGASDNERSSDPTGRPLLLQDGPRPLPDIRGVLDGPRNVGPALPTRDIVNLLAQLGEICSNESPCADGLVCGAPDNEGTRRCEPNQSGDSSEAIVPQAQPQGQESSDSSDAIVLQAEPQRLETKGQSIETQIVDLVSQNEDIIRQLEVANNSNENKRLAFLFQIGISYLPALFRELNLNIPILFTGVENYSKFLLITRLSDSNGITQELIDYVNNFIDLVYAIPLGINRFGPFWNQMKASNGWPEEFTPYDFVLTLSRYASMTNSDVIQISQDGLSSSLHVRICFC